MYGACVVFVVAGAEVTALVVVVADEEEDEAEEEGGAHNKARSRHGDGAGTPRVT